MSYSCTDFTDTILEALKIDTTGIEDSPSDQADACLAVLAQRDNDRVALRASLALMTEYADSFIQDWENDARHEAAENRVDFDQACRWLEAAQALLARIADTGAPIAPPPPAEVWTCTISTDEGIGATAHTTKAGAERAAAEFAREFWQSEGAPGEPPADDEECSAEYFDHVDREACNIERVTVEA